MPRVQRILATPNWIRRPLPAENRIRPHLNVEPPPAGQSQLLYLAANGFPIETLELALCPSAGMLCMLRAVPRTRHPALVHPLQLDLFADCWRHADSTMPVCNEGTLLLWLDPRPAAIRGISGLNTALVAYGGRFALQRQRQDTPE